MTDWLEILPTDLPTARALAFVEDPAAGGIAVFLGTTRAETHPDTALPLQSLDYEAYTDLALKQLHNLATRARQKWPVLKLALLHRFPNRTQESKACS